MADLEPVLVTRLKAFTALTDLTGTRIFPLILPQSPTYPAVTFQRISAERLSGMTAEHGMPQVRIQIDSYATTYASVKGVAAQVRAALQRWSDGTTNPAVLDVFIENELDDFEPDLESGGGVYRVIQDYIVHHRE